jgi:ligand-binding SRPBCC domain-containing protein
MARIRIETWVAAPPEVVFDLARSVEAHMASTARTGERAVGGRTSGLVELGDEVTWEAVHLGVRQRLTARITELDRPRRFVDTMVRGAFAAFYHVHEFHGERGGTRMVDDVDFRAPLGPIGRLADVLVLERYMTRFLRERAEHLKRVAEGGP